MRVAEENSPHRGHFDADGEWDIITIIRVSIQGLRFGLAQKELLRLQGNI